MNDNPPNLIDGYFDDMLSADQLKSLSEWIKAEPENARTFVQAALLHDRLQYSFMVDGDRSELDNPNIAKWPGNWSGHTWLTAVVWRAAAAVLVLVFGLVSLWFNFGAPTASAAMRELDRIIDISVRSKDRTYEIIVEEVTTPGRRGKRSMRPETQRPPKPPLDSAILHVREGNQFVLVRQTTEGLPFITGSNGKQSWSVNARGSAKVSSDIHHFDHDLPGHETSVPLTNLHEGLEQLKRSYDLEFSTLGPEEYFDEVVDTVRLLVAVKKPRERGPQRVEIAYDSRTGRILRMRFVQMPYGPDRLDLRLSLLNEHELPADFFEHAQHHAPDGKIEVEN